VSGDETPDLARSFADHMEDLVPERVPLLAWAGTALADAQALELASSTYLLISDPAFDPSTDRKVIARRFDDLRRDPLGRLLSAMYGMSGAPPEVQSNFDALNRARIDVAHHIFSRSDYVGMATTPEGITRLIELLRSWSEEFRIAADAVFNQALAGAARFGGDAHAVLDHMLAIGAAQAVPSSPAESLVGLEESITPEALDRAARRLGIDRDEISDPKAAR
jgi:hypothetical protein